MVFVPLAAPGDRVRVRIVQSRKRFARAEIAELLEPGPDRALPPCPWFGRCGGCSWQHLAYPAQLVAKAAIVGDALERIGRFHLEGAVEITPSPAPLGYRVRTRLLQQGDALGYRMRRSHDVVSIDACPVLDPRLQPVLGAVREDPGDSGEREWEAAVGSDGTVRMQRVDRPGGAVDLRIGPDLLRVSHGSFAQANGLLVEDLVRAALQQGDPRGTGSVSCVELHAGAGSFTLGLARRFDQVWAVESNAGAVRDLRFNLARAGCENVRVVEGSVEKALPSSGVHAPDLLLLDPPRSGIGEEAHAAIVEMAPARIVYVSCDPATLARDLARLRDDGYHLLHVEAFDLFPQTPHVECLATLTVGAG